MGASGTATLDFGAFPGAPDASVSVTGQSGIVANSLVEAWIMPKTTADHSADEQMLEPVKVFADASSIVQGTGFSIRGFYQDPGYGRDTPRAYGQFSVGWVWV